MAEGPQRNDWLAAVAQSPNLPPSCSALAIALAIGCSDRWLKDAWPGIGLIALRSGCSKDTARRSVRALESEGFLSIETGNGRSNRYIFRALEIDNVGKPGHPPLAKSPPVAKSTGVAKPPAPPSQNCHPGGGKTTTGGVAKPIPEPLEEPQDEPREGTSLCDGLPFEAENFPDAFERFWSIYPRPEGKEDARKAWRDAVKVECAETIIERAASYRELRAASSETAHEAYRYTMAPARWLNEKRWGDPVPNLTKADFGSSFDRTVANGERFAATILKHSDDWS